MEEKNDVLKMKDSLEDSFLAALDAAEEVIRAQNELHVALQDGFFDLTRARYNMGPLRVGKLQWSERSMSALSVINVELNSASSECNERNKTQLGELVNAPSGGSFGLKLGVGPAVFRLEKVGSDAVIESKDGGESKEGESIGGEGLRQRRQRRANEGETVGKERGGEGEEGLDDERSSVQTSTSAASSEGDAASSSKKREDPLRWFGGLVPPSLREAQGKFLRAVECVVDVASAKEQLRVKMANYMEMRSSSSSSSSFS